MSHVLAHVSTSAKGSRPSCYLFCQGQILDTQMQIVKLDQMLSKTSLLRKFISFVPVSSTPSHFRSSMVLLMQHPILFVSSLYLSREQIQRYLLNPTMMSESYRRLPHSPSRPSCSKSQEQVLETSRS